MTTKGGGLCHELELDFSPFSPRTAACKEEPKPPTDSQNSDLLILQQRNRVANSLDRCVDQRNRLVIHGIRQILATCEGQLSALLTRLRDIKERLEQADHKSEVIQQLLAADVPESDEFGCLVKSIIRLSLEGAQKKHADTARNKLIANSERQAQELAPTIAELKDAGAKTLQELANGLNGRSIRTKNGHIWYSSTVKLLLQKIDQLEAKSLVLSK